MFGLDSYGKIVSFQVYPIAILGDNYRTVKVLSIVDYATARIFTDVNNLSVSVYPSLPKGTPKDLKKYMYLKVEHLSGKISCVAIPWINLDTVIFHTDVLINVSIKLKHINDVETVRKLLLANNIEPLEITVQ